MSYTRRALERVAGLNDPDRGHVEEALSVYLPRAVLALFTIINKLDGIFGVPDNLANHLRALLLSACDEANALWPEDGSRQRPKQLTLPGRFLEEKCLAVLGGGDRSVVQRRSRSGYPALVGTGD